MNKCLACAILLVMLFTAANALLAQQPKPEETPAAGDEGEIYYVATVEGEYAGREQISVSRVTEAGVKCLRFAYEAEFKTETTNMGFTSARGTCLMETDGLTFNKATITRFNGPVTLADAEVTFAKNLLTTRTVGVEVPAVDSAVAPGSRLRTSWMVEKELLSNLPIEPGREISYLEVTGVGDDAEAVKQVRITVASKEERKIGQKTVDGWRLELRYSGASEQLPLVLFVDNLGRVLEKTYGNLVLMRVYSREETLASQEYLFEQRGRRDPFIPRLVYVGKEPTPPGGVKKPVDGGKVGPTLSAEDAKRIVVSAQAEVAKMKLICETTQDDAEKDAKLAECTKNLLEFQKQLAKTPHEAQKKALESLMREGDTFYGPKRRLLQEARDCYDSAIRKFESEFYDKIADDKKRLDEILAERAVRDDTTLEPEVKEMATGAAKLVQRAQVRQAFNTLSLRVTGIVYHVTPQTEPLSLNIELFQRTLPIRTNIKTWISASEAIIAAGAQDQAVKDGSKVEIVKDTGVSVFRIEPGAVLFEYRDEIIRVPLAR